MKTKEVSFQVSLENCHGLSIPDGGGGDHSTHHHMSCR